MNEVEKKNQDYKDTLNLPETDFPMKANLSEREPAMVAKWQNTDLYQQIRKKLNGKPKYILSDGPPYANGDIHIGHAVNKILKDIIVKFKTLSGVDAPFVPGWDCHGLPVELNVEKKVGKPGEKLSPRAFRDACREYVESQVNAQRTSFIRLGVLGDWNKPYLTMSPEYEADIIRSIGKIYQNGHLQEGFKPVHWCMDCASALAEAEVEYKDKTSPSIDVAFRVVDKNLFLSKIKLKNEVDALKDPKMDVAIAIWTTTPWSLPANEAVALHHHIEYDLVWIKNATNTPAFILVAKDLLSAFIARLGEVAYELVGKTEGEPLEGLLLHHPYLEKQVPITLGEHVTLDAGTGAVHTAPAHGLEDFWVGQKYQLPINNPVDEKGCFKPDTPFFAGMHVFKANPHIVELLKERNNLLSYTEIQHSFPHCWRHKTPLIFRATPQWFISMDDKGLRQNSLKAINEVSWVPEWGASRISLMIEGRPDWCISRQRTWGVPIPLLIHKDTNALHPETAKLIDWVADKVGEQGIDFWHEVAIEELPVADTKSYRKVMDSLDVWFDSGVYHTCVLKKHKDLAFPADLYLEGSDQHRGWFQSSLLSSVAMYKTPPYRKVLTHGFTVDASGRKMSKSLGNVVAPSKVMNTLGADILRLWVSATDYKNEMHVSDEILKRTADAYRRIRNTMRFLLANLSGFNPEKHSVPMQDLLPLDAWAIDCAKSLQTEIIKAYEEFQFHQIYQKTHNFCVVEMGSFYLDIIKDRQYTTQKESLARRSAQTALYHIAECLTKWLAPILSFTAEEIWQYLPNLNGKRSASVFLSEWHPIEEMTKGLEKSIADIWNNAYWQKMITVREAVNKAIELLRIDGKIRGGLQAEVTLYAKQPLMNELAQLGEELRFVLITSSATLLPFEEAPLDVALTDIAELKVVVKASQHTKCVRCWHYRIDVGHDKAHPELCARCVTNVTSTGETRMYA